MTTSVLREIERKAIGLERAERERLSPNGRRQAKELIAAITALQKQLAPGLSTFSPEAAGERIVADMKAAEGGAWSGAELRAKFGLTAAVLHRRRKEHRIIYWRDAREDYFYPRWQFTQSGALLPGIQEVLQTFNSQDEWRVIRYFLSPRKQLSNRRPLELLRAGEVETILAHSRDHAAENTW